MRVQWVKEKKLTFFIWLCAFTAIISFQNCQQDSGRLINPSSDPVALTDGEVFVQKISVEDGLFKISGRNLDLISKLVLQDSATDNKTVLNLKSKDKTSATAFSSSQINLLSNIVYKLLVSTANAADQVVPVQVDYKSIPADGIAIGGNQLVIKNGNVGINTLDPTMGLGWGGSGETILGVSGYGSAKNNGYAGRGMLFLDNPISSLALGQSLGAIVITGQNVPTNKIFGFVDVVSTGLTGETGNQLGGSFVFYTKMRGSNHQVAMILRDDKSLDVKGNLIVAGNITYGGTVTSSSDRALKKDIQTIPDVVQKIAKINGVTYNWIDSQRGTRRQMGVIAQDVQQAFPELVYQDESGYLSVNYMGLVGPLIETAKSQQNEIELLKKKLEDQDQTMRHLEARLNKLDKTVH